MVYGKQFKMYRSIGNYILIIPFNKDVATIAVIVTIKHFQAGTFLLNCYKAIHFLGNIKDI